MDNKQITWTNAKRKLSELIPWTRNPRQIKVEQIERLQESLTEFGQPETITIGPGNELYNGHQRLKSWADKFGDIEVDVRISDRPLTEKEREKLTIFLHKGAVGEWDFNKMANEFEVDNLLDWGFEKQELDLNLWDTDESEPDPGTQIDRAEELREKWGVETGQLWQLSKHRLICGDCTDAEVVDKVMEGKVSFAFADPPYNAGVDEWDEDFEWSQDWLIDLAQIVAVTPGISSICDFMRLTAMPYKWSISAYISNGHARGAIGFGNWIYAAVFSKESVFQQKRDAIQIDLRVGEADGEYHRGQKPPQFMDWIIDLFTDNGEVVFDPFLGSGTTMVAAQRLGRRCFGIEINPAYCAIAIQRWVAMTGGEPELINI